MQERDLRAFVSVVETGRMDLAAKELGYTQPAISYQIRCLEQVLQVKLFAREGRGVSLTAEGRAVLPTAREILKHCRRLRESLGDRDAD